MGSITQKAMRRLGVNENFIKKIFQSAQDRMLQAIMAGDLLTVELIHTQQKFDFAELTDDFENCLHVAVKYNQLAIAKYILQSHMENQNDQFHMLEDKNMQGDSPLMVAVMTKNLEITRYLILETGARVRSRENIGGTIFMAACASGNLDIVRFIYDQPVNFYSKNNDGQNALHRACFFGEIQVVRFLLKNTKLQILSKDKHGNNCFHLASKRLNITLLRYLLKKFKKQSAIFNITNGENQTFIQVLSRIFNSIREIGYEPVTDKEITNYIHNKQLPPEILPWVRKQHKKTNIGLDPKKNVLLIKHMVDEDMDNPPMYQRSRRRGTDTEQNQAIIQQIRTTFNQQKGHHE